ncbi:exodeoxyribonuclease V subunit beta [Thiomicrospira cyclica]|uniref:RecBCD enzyme subunit RecB n=1 Tax=Thiomicrospira cyclica (strain DSM 14477 / JCM 11371 / ALM1) TaxID=717773 RepID=F6DBR3_THICA|nr:exodeoxyribonuclease V subunit beta [Thiomicrospira cyclica]AEG31299.1 exodeoxyribonuclease V, beta subunit [Thiomicrospira cyclica ALM1]
MTHSNHYPAFEVMTHDLKPESCLIEASAGTGKTFSIAFLVLRLVVEKALPIEQILIVTFTDAATQELRERVRQRLVDAKNALNGEVGNDELLNNWLAQLDNIVPKADAQARLVQALASIDQASISTIHGFCQKVLTEYPLESEQVFGQSLTTDMKTIYDELVADFWRQTVYNRAESDVEMILSVLPSPKDLHKLLEAVKQPGLVITPEVPNLDNLMTELLAHQQVWQNWIAQSRPQIDDFIAEAQAQKWINARSQNKLQELLDNFTDDPIALLAYLEQGKAFNKTGKTAAEAFVAKIHPGDTNLNNQSRLYKTLAITLQSGFSMHVQLNLLLKLQAQNLMSFNDLIQRLYHALQQPNAANLIAQVQGGYQAALIDEFQDTDQWQWGIFSKLFNYASHYLFLIGDPKQAIYKFRGADIHAYFAAAADCQSHYTLDTNWRSQPNLVAAVNQVFDVENPFQFDALNFQPVKAGVTADPQLAQQPAWHWLTMPASEDGKPWPNKASEPIIQQNLLAEISELLQHQSVLPKQIAILVRSNFRAESYRQALAQLGIPAVIKSRESIYSTPQAEQLYRVIAAILEPNNSRLIKPLLGLDWFGLNSDQVHHILNSDELEHWFELMQSLNQRWHKTSFIAALYTLLEQKAVFEHLTEFSDAERRIANIQQLAESIQSDIHQHHLTPAKTLEFVAQQLSNPDTDDAHIVRLDRDDEALQIVTIHASKGLEYDYVFCPDLWQGKAKANKPTDPVRVYENGTWLLDLGSDDYEKNYDKAYQEQQAENLRLAYVALTRAKIRNTVVTGDQLSGFDISPLGYLQQQGQMVNQASSEADNKTSQANNLFIQRELSLSTEAIIYQPQVVARDYQACSLQRKTIDTRYRLFSFSGLVKAGHSLASLGAQVSAELEPANEAPTDKAQELSLLVQSDNEQTDHRFDPNRDIARGAHFGNVVHDLLEQQPFVDLANTAIGVDAELRQRLCQKYGLKLNATQEQALDDLMRRIVTTPLSSEDTDVTLAQLSPNKVLKEMAFYYRLASSSTQQLNDAMPKDVPFLALKPQQLVGYLNGFIDLVFEHNGRYYLLDYKTNYLGSNSADYTPDRLFEEMQHHSYGLQFMLYSLALHQYLSHRLPNYDYEQHFAGVVYGFVRGMNGKNADTGIYHYRPNLADIERLASCLNSVTANQQGAA